MDVQKLMVGYDLCPDYSQISYYDIEKNEPQSLSYGETAKIPTALCKVDNSDKWLAGAAAVAAADAGLGELIRGFTEDLKDEPMMTIGATSYEKDELIGRFVSMTLEGLGEMGAGISHITVTMEQMDIETVAAIKKLAAILDISESQLGMQSHKLSYAYYALSQRRELWMHDVGMFELDSKGLFYHHLTVSWRSHPAQVSIEDIDLTEYIGSEAFGASDLAEQGLWLDKQFAEAIKTVTASKTISTFYLVGDGFEGNDGESFMNLSLRQLCAMRRHVFVGQNLYSRGACYNSYYMGTPGSSPGFWPVNADILMKDVYINSVHRNSLGKVMLSKAGMPWYGISECKYILIDDSDNLVLHVRDGIGNSELIYTIKLTDLPHREARTTRLKVEVSFKSLSLCHIRVRDMGFGEIATGSDKVWEYEIELDSITESTAYVGNGTVIETHEPVTRLPLEMKMSGMKVYTLEELCWYFAKNVYAISMDMFDESMFRWMDAITGDRTLSLAIRNYIDGGRPLADVVRLLLSSIDYLTRTELADVIRCLNDMDRQDPLEQLRLAADNYLRYGHFMAALSTYLRVLGMFNSEIGADATRRFKAETLHNMGVCYMKLHHPSRASECMEKAYALEPSREFLQAWIRVLVMAGELRQLEALAKRADVSAFTAGELKTEAEKILTGINNSDEAAEFDRELARIKKSDEDYDKFVKDFISKEKKRYDLG